MWINEQEQISILYILYLQLQRALEESSSMDSGTESLLSLLELVVLLFDLFAKVPEGRFTIRESVSSGFKALFTVVAIWGLERSR